MDKNRVLQVIEDAVKKHGKNSHEYANIFHLVWQNLGEEFGGSIETQEFKAIIVDLLKEGKLILSTKYIESDGFLEHALQLGLPPKAKKAKKK